MTQTSTIAAGIDVAKAKLDVAVEGCSERWQVANTAAGWRDLVGLMRRRKVTRIGLEASGGYERDAVEHLRKAGFTKHRSRSRHTMDQPGCHRVMVAHHEGV